jgi:hypothetical protein
MVGFLSILITINPPSELFAPRATSAAFDRVL